MKRRILSMVLALSLCISLSSLAYAQPRTGFQEDTTVGAVISEVVALEAPATDVSNIEAMSVKEDSDGGLSALADVVPTPSEIYSAMTALQTDDRYKEGADWSDYGPLYDKNKGNGYVWKGGKINGVTILAYGCVAFAFTLSDAAFGSLPNRAYTAGKFNYEDIKAGDVLRVNNNTHTVIVLEVTDDGVVLAEGNYGGRVHWGRTMSKNEVMNRTATYITRYPEGYVAPDDQDAKVEVAKGFAGSLSWSLNKAGTLTVTGTGAMPNYSGPSDTPWSTHAGTIRKVVIGDGVTSIGNSAFYNCGVLGVDIPSTVTQIGSNAFFGSKLIMASIPASVKTIGESAFRNCQSMRSLAFAEGVEIIQQNAFRGCTSLAYVQFPASVKEVGAGAFMECTEMTEMEFFPGNNVVKFGDNIFTRCYKLMSVLLPRKADRIGAGMFQNCSMLPGVQIPDGVTEIGEQAFASSGVSIGVSVMIIPVSVKSIGIAAFSSTPLSNGSTGSKIYYGGTKAQWGTIQKIGDTVSALSKVAATELTLKEATEDAAMKKTGIVYNFAISAPSLPDPIAPDSGSSATPTNPGNQINPIPSNPSNPSSPSNPSNPTYPTNPSNPPNQGTQDPTDPGTQNPANPTNPGAQDPNDPQESDTPNSNKIDTAAITSMWKDKMYRMYNPNSGEHFYTRNSAERNYLASVGWKSEGSAWIAPTSGNPVYRMYNPNSGDHHYTLNRDERDMLKEAGWGYEGIGWYSHTGERTPLYRLYNPNVTVGTHHYTVDVAERDALVAAGWHDEGVAWYGM